MATAFNAFRLRAWLTLRSVWAWAAQRGMLKPKFDDGFAATGVLWCMQGGERIQQLCTGKGVGPAQELSLGVSARLLPFPHLL